MVKSNSGEFNFIYINVYNYFNNFNFHNFYKILEIKGCNKNKSKKKEELSLFQLVLD